MAFFENIVHIIRNVFGNIVIYCAVATFVLLIVELIWYRVKRKSDEA